MKVIGLTGGVGAGKSTVLSALKKMYNVRVLLTDDIARDLQAPGNDCYNMIRKAFDDDSLYLPDGSMNREAFASLVFADDSKRKLLDSIVHPAVDSFVLKSIQEEKKLGKTEAVIIESAILLDVDLKNYCDELWFVFAPLSVRKERLKKSRGYSEDKIRSIIKTQKSDEEFKTRCDRIIINDGDENTLVQALKGIL